MAGRCGSSRPHPRHTSEAVLAQEEAILTWAMAAQADPPHRRTPIDRDGLDPLQADAAAAVAGARPAGARRRPGRRRQDPHAHAAVDDLTAHGRVVFGVAPTAKAARSLERDTGIAADTVAKLLHEWPAARPATAARVAAARPGRR